MTVRFLTLALTAILLTMTPGLALAQAEEEAQSDDERARELYLRGDRLYAEGLYEEAVAAFDEAHALTGRPLLLFNLANAHERLGNLEEAISLLRRYAPDAPEYEHDTIARRIRNLERRIEEAGANEIGGPDLSTEQDINAIEDSLTRAPPPAESEQESSGVSIPGVVFLSVGIAALVAGGIFGGLALGKGSDLDDECLGQVCSEASRGLVDDQQTFALVADIGFIVGGIGSLVGLGFLVFD
ncbi:MAG: tetratricopeptide repeat protein [Myxococcota bacterium]